MRAADRHEVEQLGYSPLRGLWMSHKGGLVNKTALVNGKVAAMWGLQKVSDSEGMPWFLTGQALEEAPPLFFVKTYKKEVQSMLKLLPKLVNYVLADYDSSIRILRMAGFSIGKPEPYGSGIFKRFEINT